jgi:hypothetical protein
MVMLKDADQLLPQSKRGLLLGGQAVWPRVHLAGQPSGGQKIDTGIAGYHVEVLKSGRCQPCYWRASHPVS